MVEHRLVQRPTGSPALRTGVDGDAVDVAMVVVALLEPPVVGRGVVGTGSQHQHEPLELVLGADRDHRQAGVRHDRLQPVTVE